MNNDISQSKLMHFFHGALEKYTLATFNCDEEIICLWSQLGDKPTLRQPSI